MTEAFGDRCERYMRDEVPFIGWVYYDGYCVIRTDDVQLKPPRGAFESDEAYTKRCAKVKPSSLSKSGRREVDRIVARLGHRLIRYVKYSPETGLTEVLHR